MDAVRMRHEVPPHDTKTTRSVSAVSEYIPHGSLLESAACQFDLEKVNEILEEGSIDVNDVNDTGKNALHEMIERYVNIDHLEKTHVKSRLLEIVSKFVAKGLDMNAHVVSGKGTTLRKSKFTALHIVSCCADSGDLIRALFCSGANVNFADGHKRTPLHLATERALLSNVDALIDGGADVNSPDEYVQTPLHYAVKGRYRARQVINALIDAGANVNSEDTMRKTPVHVAAKYANADVMALLLSRGGNATKPDGTGQTPVHYAALHDCSGDVLKALLSVSPDVNHLDDVTMESPLHKAVRHHMTENVINLCASENVNPNIRDIYGETPIHKAAKLSDWSMWTALLKCGGDVERKNDQGVTPLMLLTSADNGMGTILAKFHKQRGIEY